MKWYQIQYKCPHCAHEWTDYHSCACNDECEECGVKDIEPSKVEEVG